MVETDRKRSPPPLLDPCEIISPSISRKPQNSSSNHNSYWPREIKLDSPFTTPTNTVRPLPK